MMLKRPFAEKTSEAGLQMFFFFFHFFVRTSKRSNKSVVDGVRGNLSPFVPAHHRLKRTPSPHKKGLLFGGETFYPVDDGADSRPSATESTFSEHAEAF